MLDVVGARERGDGAIGDQHRRRNGNGKQIKMKNRRKLHTASKLADISLISSGASSSAASAVAAPTDGYRAALELTADRLQCSFLRRLHSSVLRTIFTSVAETKLKVREIKVISHSSPSPRSAACVCTAHRTAGAARKLNAFESQSIPFADRTGRALCDLRTSINPRHCAVPHRAASLFRTPSARQKCDKLSRRAHSRSGNFVSQFRAANGDALTIKSKIFPIAGKRRSASGLEKRRKRGKESRFGLRRCAQGNWFSLTRKFFINFVSAVSAISRERRAHVASIENGGAFLALVPCASGGEEPYAPENGR